MEISQDIREAIILNATSVELKKAAVANGMKTIRRSGLQKISEGITTIEEVVRETVH
jgi:type IV pilus assembly protein PilB